MANDIVAFRMEPEQKHALKVLAAEADMTITDYVLDILRKHTTLDQRASLLAKRVPDMGRNISEQRPEPASA
jgi:hypothetical protein